MVDNISPAVEASSIYFGTLGQIVTGSGPSTVAIASATSSGALFSTDTATITTKTAHGFANGAQVTIAGVTCTCTLGYATFNGTWTIASVTFDYFHICPVYELFRCRHDGYRRHGNGDQPSTKDRLWCNQVDAAESKLGCLL